jgi:hypothetical protein
LGERRGIKEFWFWRIGKKFLSLFIRKSFGGGLFLEAFVALVEGFARGKRTKVVRRRRKKPRLFCGKRSAVKGVGGGRGEGEGLDLRDSGMVVGKKKL